MDENNYEYLYWDLKKQVDKTRKIIKDICLPCIIKNKCKLQDCNVYKIKKELGE